MFDLDNPLLRRAQKQAEKFAKGQITMEEFLALHPMERSALAGFIAGSTALDKPEHTYALCQAMVKLNAPEKVN